MDSRIPEILAAIDGGHALTHQDARDLAEALLLVTTKFGHAMSQLFTTREDLARVIGERDEAREALLRLRRVVAGT